MAEIIFHLLRLAKVAASLAAPVISSGISQWTGTHARDVEARDAG